MGLRDFAASFFVLFLIEGSCNLVHVIACVID